MNPDGLNRIDGGARLTIGQVPVSNLLQKAESLRQSSELKKTMGELAEQILKLDLQVKDALGNVEEQKNEVGIQKKTLDKLTEKLENTNSLVVLGLGIAILAAFAVVAAVFIFFAQTAIDTHRDLNNFQPPQTKVVAQTVPSPSPVFKKLP